MEKVKVGLVGLGNQGRGHAQMLNDIPSVDFVAACDIVKEKADDYAKRYNVTPYYNYKDMLENEKLDAIAIAVPHYDHTPMAIDALKMGLHVMCEKPLAVHVNDCQKMIDAYNEAKQKGFAPVFAIMFQERTFAHYRKIKTILESGRLGKLIRVTWIDTTRFRTQTYFNSGGWRATWAGEGGGILTNQCPHSLDMYQWLFGLPKTVNGFANIGKYHDIEVEDEVTAYFQHENGMIGHFIVSTGEAPGSFRIEIMAENGKLVFENGKLTYFQNVESMLDVLKNSKKSFDSVENWVMDIPYSDRQPTGHKPVMEKFINSIVTGKEDLTAHATEGLNSVMLANAIMHSSFTQQTVTLPMNGDVFEAKLKELIKTSKYVKTVVEDKNVNMEDSYAK